MKQKTKEWVQWNCNQKMVFGFHNTHIFDSPSQHLHYLLSKHEQHGLAVPRHKADRIAAQIQRSEQRQPLEPLHFSHRTEHVLRQVEMLRVGVCARKKTEREMIKSEFAM